MKIFAAAITAFVAIQFLSAAKTISKEYEDADQVLVLAISEGFFPKPTHFVWNDGVFLIWPYPEKDPIFAFIGRYELEDLERSLREIDATNFHELERKDYGVPDSGWTEIYAVTKSRTLRVSWHEYLHPGFGWNISTDKHYREFVKNWNRVRAAETRLTPVEIFLLKDREELAAKKTFRGVNLKEPRKSNLPELENPNKAE